MSQDKPANAPRPAGAPGMSGVGRVRGFSPLPTGTRIGELSVQSVLGAGEFGITYVAEHEKRSKRYALKEYFPRSIAQREGLAVRPRPEAAAVYAWGLDRFLSEARSLQEVKHPALSSILGVTQHGGTGYVGMAYEQGVDFSIWLHERKRIAPQEDLDPLLAPLIEGVALAHSSKVFHLDITPDCLIVRETGGAVLVDFGVFRVGLRRRLPPGNLREQTYAAPELLAASGGPIGPWTDIYSLAGLLYLAVTGRPPLSAVERAGGTALEPAATAAKGKYRADFLHAIDHGLKLAPAQRPRSVADWGQALLRPAGSRFAVSRWLGSRSSPAARLGTAIPVQAAKPPVAREEPVSLGGTPVAAAAAGKGTASSAQTAGGARSTANALIAMTGSLAGAGVGGLAGAGLAGVLRPDCTAGGCTTQLAVPMAVIGAVVGLWEAYRYARRRDDERRAASNIDI
jgi:hypothetical protein